MKKTSLLLVLALAAALPAFAADVPEAPSRYAATIAPAERFEVGAMLVERHGKAGRPLVLIPGLAGGAWVWQGLVREFSRDHVVYVVTLPGFDGRAPAGGNEMDAARKALLELVTSRHLDKPVLMGHSLGGMLALSLAEDSPGLVGGVVSIDGLPVFPGTEDMPPEQRLQSAQAARARAAGATGPAFAAQQQRYMRGIGVLDMNMADELAKLSAKSDPGAVAGYVAGALAFDLRPGLAKITAPVLVLAPYFDADAAQQQIGEQDKVAYYQSLMAGTSKLTVVPVSPSRHFAMFDQPVMVVEAIRRYLNAL